MNNNEISDEEKLNTHSQIRGEPAIAEQIAKYLAEPRDRSRLATTRIAERGNYDRICLPSGSTFRTSMDPEGCGPWTVNAQNCCVQSDTGFLGAVATIMAGAHRTFGKDRIADEIKRWMTTVRAEDLPDTNLIDVNFPGPDRHKHLLKLAVKAQTSVPISVRILRSNQTINPNEFDLSRLRGSLRLYPGRYFSSLSYSSINEILVETPHLRSLVVDCPISIPAGVGINAITVAEMIDDVRFANSGRFMYEFTLPPAIHVNDVSNELVTTFDDWHRNAGGDVVRSSDWSEDSTKVRIDAELNRLSVTVLSPVLVPL